jgi:5-methylcytosine-specific restriction protein A
MAWKGGNTTARGYGHAWRKRRAQALRRDSALCQSCIKQGRYIPATEVDHIIEKAKGGTDDLSNLQSLCTPCHRVKTSGKKVSGCDVNGMPLDPNHHWNVGGGGSKV